MEIFHPSELIKLYKPAGDTNGEDNGQVTIIGGSSLFHGAPLLSLKVASRIVDMVFFATPEKSVGHVAETVKSKLLSFIWVPWEDAEDYIKKSDAVLIGPGFMRFGKESTADEMRGYENHEEGKRTRQITEHLLKKFPEKRWVIDAGSLQTMDAGWIPEGSVLTPNRREFEILFKVKIQISKLKTTTYNLKLKELVQVKAEQYNCIVILKGPVTYVSNGKDTVEVHGGNPGMTKGGTGDVLAGLTVALFAKNDPFLAATSASFIVKASGDELFKRVGVNYNADDLANKIPETLNKLHG